METFHYLVACGKSTLDGSVAVEGMWREEATGEEEEEGHSESLT